MLDIDWVKARVVRLDEILPSGGLLPATGLDVSAGVRRRRRRRRRRAG